MSRSTRTGRSTTGPSHKTPRTNNKAENLTLEQLPNAIEQYNERKRTHFILSFERYQKYHHLIQGALSFEEYQTSHEMTEQEFVKKVFGNMEHLTLDQLFDTIREFKTAQGMRITSPSTYRTLHTQIKGAFSFETYQTLYGITAEEFLKTIQSKKCETEFTRT